LSTGTNLPNNNNNNNLIKIFIIFVPCQQPQGQIIIQRVHKDFDLPIILDLTVQAIKHIPASYLVFVVSLPRPFSVLDSFVRMEVNCSDKEPKE
jgi:hypothetical protein